MEFSKKFEMFKPILGAPNHRRGASAPPSVAPPLANHHCQEMMENCLDAIVVLNNASEGEHHLVDRPSRDQKFHSHISCNGKHFFDLNSMIDCFFTENHQRCYALGTGTQPNHYFLWKRLSLLNATVFIGISTIYCPHSIVLRIIDTINVKNFSSEKRILIVSSFRKLVRTRDVRSTGFDPRSPQPTPRTGGRGTKTLRIREFRVMSFVSRSRRAGRVWLKSKYASYGRSEY